MERYQLIGSLVRRLGDSADFVAEETISFTGPSIEKDFPTDIAKELPVSRTLQIHECKSTHFPNIGTHLQQAYVPKPTFLDCIATVRV